MRYAAAVLLVCAVPAYAAQPVQDNAPYAQQRRENTRVVRIQLMQLVPGGRHRANEIIYKHFLPAMREAGITVPTVIDPDSGEWDYIIITPLEGGYGDLGHTTTAADARWLNVLAKREASQKAADALEEEFGRLLARQQVIIGHEHLPRQR